MATLSEPIRLVAWADIQRTEDCPGGVTKADLKAAIDAADNWVDANAAAFNSALPAAARTGMTARQKARLLLHIVSKRWEVS